MPQQGIKPCWGNERELHEPLQHLSSALTSREVGLSVAHNLLREAADKTQLYVGSPWQVMEDQTRNVIMRPDQQLLQELDGSDAVRWYKQRLMPAP